LELGSTDVISAKVASRFDLKLATNGGMEFGIIYHYLVASPIANRKRSTRTSFI